MDHGKQPWSNGKVGMVGISGYAGEQWRAAAQGHPALESHLSVRPWQRIRRHVRIPDFNPGGMLHTSPICSMSSARS